MKWFWLIVTTYIIIGLLLAIGAQWSIIKLLKLKGKDIIKEFEENAPIILLIILIWPVILIMPFARDKMHRNRSNF